MKNKMMQSLGQKVVMKKFTDSLLEQKQVAELQLLCKEKDVEAEHKLNTLIALNEKLEVFNDLKKDVTENKEFVRQSEEARRGLQVQINVTAEKLAEDTNIKQKYQESLSANIKSLQEEIQEQERAKAKQQQDHLAARNAQESRHQDQLNECNKTIADLKDAHNKREQEWNQTRTDDENRHNEQRNAKNTEMEALDKKYREDLQAEKDRHHRELKNADDLLE